MTNGTSHQIVTLLGSDHLVPDQYAMCSVGDDWLTYCSISLGSVEALARKGATDVPNEDSLFAADFGDRAVQVIADGHKGHEASHEIVERIADLVQDSSSVYEPLRTLDWCVGPFDEYASRTSRTTVTVTALDRQRKVLSGLSLGDSSVFLLRLSEGVRRLNPSTANYLAPWAEEPPALSNIVRFKIDLAEGDIVLSCSDGLTECHYGQPATSITEADLETIRIQYGGDLDRFVEELSKTALKGVRGNPGGQDNVTIVATLV